MAGGPLYTGCCLCGDIKLEAFGELKWIAHCHCPSCQKVSGTGFATYAGFNKQDVRLTEDKLKTFRASVAVARSFCKKCGVPVKFEGEAWPDEVHIHLAMLDNAADLQPLGNVHVKTRLPWVHLEDGLVAFDRFPK